MVILTVNRHSEDLVLFGGIGSVEVDYEHGKVLLFCLVAETSFLDERYFSFCCNENPTDEDQTDQGNGNDSRIVISSLGVFGLFFCFL